MKTAFRRNNVLILLTLILGFGLRVWGLADRSIWWDEGWSLSLARESLTEILRFVSYDNHPPVHQLALHGWWHLAGEGEFTMRFLSVLSGWLWIVLTYKLGAIIADRQTGLLAALFLALSRFAITWSQDIRMYTWSAALATMILWTALRLWRRPNLSTWLPYVLAVTAGLLSLYLTISAPLVTNLVFLMFWLRRRRPRALLGWWVSAQLAALLLFLPWMILNVSHADAWTVTQTITLSDVSLYNYIRLYATMLVVGNPLNVEAYIALTAGVVGISIFGGVVLFRQKQSLQQRHGLIMLVMGIVVQALVVYAICFGIIPGLTRPLAPRYLLLLSSCFYILLAWGIRALGSGATWRRWIMRGTTIFVILAAISGLRTYYPGRARRDDYISIAQVLNAHRRPEDKVLLYVDRDWPLFAAHYPGEWRGVPYGTALDETSVDAFLSPIWENVHGVWLVTTPEALQTDPQQTLRRWLEEHAAGGSIWIEGENTLGFYARTSTRLDKARELTPDFETPANINAQIDDGFLLGATLPLNRYRTGDTLHLSLYWLPPPSSTAIVEITGAETQQINVIPPIPVRQGATRQQVDIPLTPALPGGHYQVRIHGNSDVIEVGKFTLIRKAVGTEVSAADIANPVNYQLGDVIQLIGYDLPQREVQSGDVIPLTLYWQTQSEVATRYKVFTHLLGEVYNAETDNFLWGQQDNEPGDGQLLTTLWSPKTIIVDRYRIPVAPNTPSGTYTLEIGMYGLVDGARLPILDSEGQPLGDAIILASVNIHTP